MVTFRWKFSLEWTLGTKWSGLFHCVVCHDKGFVTFESLLPNWKSELQRSPNSTSLVARRHLTVNDVGKEGQRCDTLSLRQLLQFSRIKWCPISLRHLESTYYVKTVHYTLHTFLFIWRKNEMGKNQHLSTCSLPGTHQLWTLHTQLSYFNKAAAVLRGQRFMCLHNKGEFKSRATLLQSYRSGDFCLLHILHTFKVEVKKDFSAFFPHTGLNTPWTSGIRLEPLI